MCLGKLYPRLKVRGLSPLNYIDVMGERVRGDRQPPAFSDYLSTGPTCIVSSVSESAVFLNWQQ